MKVTLTKKESREIFHTAMCNGLGWVSSYGLFLEYDKEEYRTTSKSLKHPCHEDVLLRMLENGNTITVVDEEDEDGDVEITIDKVYDRMNNVPIDSLLRIINETDDVIDADVVLQTVFFNEVIYG